MNGPPLHRWRWPSAALLVLPVLFLVAGLYVRDAAGPFWLWFNLDPDYGYLLNALRIAEGRPPTMIEHPGTTIQTLDAAILKIWHAGAQRVAAVMDDPERHLSALALIHVSAIATAMLAVGIAAYRLLGDLTGALLAQSGPLLIGLTLKHAPHTKPEPLLVVAMLALTGLAATSLRGDLMERHRDRIAGWLGVIAGFTLATKITAAPVLILPLLILGRWRAVAIYAAVAGLAFALFLVPAWPMIDRIIEWISKIALGSGAYGAGAGKIVDLAAYPGNLRKLLARPLFHGPLLVAAGLVVWSRWRALPRLEIRLLTGIAVAQALHVAVVAKHPSAHYLIPSYVLGGLTLMVVFRLATGGHLGAWAARPGTRIGAAVLALAVAASQASSVYRMGQELRRQHNMALSVDHRRFVACAQVYTDFASSPAYALHYGGVMDGNLRAAELSARLPANHFWYVGFRHEFRDRDGLAEVGPSLAPYECIVLRGSVEQGMFGGAESVLRNALPDRAWNRSCSTREEIVLASGIACP